MATLTSTVLGSRRALALELGLESAVLIANHHLDLVAISLVQVKAHLIDNRLLLLHGGEKELLELGLALRCGRCTGDGWPHIDSLLEVFLGVVRDGR